jgi:hypothetical protein
VSNSSYTVRWRVTRGLSALGLAVVFTLALLAVGERADAGETPGGDLPSMWDERP